MGEQLNIKPPCKDCPLYVESGESIEDIYDRRLLPMARDGVERALACRHPWRVANVRFNGNPNLPQREVLSRLVEIRHKDPSEYGLAPSMESAARESYAKEAQRADALRLMIDGLSELPADDPEALEELLAEFYGRDDFESDWVDEALAEYSALNKRN